MINLIPNQEKKKMLADLYFRLASLFFIMLSFVLVIASVALLPSYLLSLSKNKIVKDRLETQKAIPLPLFNQEALDVAKDLNYKVQLIEKTGKNKFAVSEKAIQAVISKKIPNVKISHISYENNSISGKKISLRGTAPSREVLLSFRQALEQD